MTTSAGSLYLLAEDILSLATHGNCDNILASPEALQCYAADKHGATITEMDASLVIRKMQVYLENEACNAENDWYGDIYLALSKR
jgi:hypothetical protein